MNFREEVKRTASFGTRAYHDELALGALGLVGEAGEVADLLKKYIYHGKTLDKDALLKELGDVRWYLEYLLISTGYTMEQVETANVEKLRKRYPHGFNTADANSRKDEK